MAVLGCQLPGERHTKAPAVGEWRNTTSVTPCCLIVEGRCGAPKNAAVKTVWLRIAARGMT